MAEFVRAAGVSEVPPGTVKEVEVNGRTVAPAKAHLRSGAQDRPGGLSLPG